MTQEIFRTRKRSCIAFEFGLVAEAKAITSPRFATTYVIDHVTSRNVYMSIDDMTSDISTRQEADTRQNTSANPFKRTFRRLLAQSNK